MIALRVRNSKHDKLYFKKMNTPDGFVQPMLKILFVIIAAVMVVSNQAEGQPADSLQGSLSITDDKSPNFRTNTDIVASETVNLFLVMLDDNRQLQQPNDGRVIEQPVNLEMDAPATVREKIISELLLQEVRVADNAAAFHTIRMEWEPDNILIRRGGRDYKRILSSEVIFTWLNPDREVEAVWRESFSVEEQITADQWDTLTGDWGPSVFHAQQDSRRSAFLKRIAEPAIITGAITVTVYLLYNVRR